MKYVIVYNERPSGSARDYEEAQKRVLELFGKLQFPESFKINMFLSQVGRWSGFIIADVDDLSVIQKITSIFPIFSFEAYPVLDINVAVSAEMDAIAWRDSVGKS